MLIEIELTEAEAKAVGQAMADMGALFFPAVPWTAERLAYFTASMRDRWARTGVGTLGAAFQQWDRAVRVALPEPAPTDATRH
jgi:hypothetical protein